LQTAREGAWTLDQYELDLMVSVNLIDLNDSRSIVNEVELVGYDTLDMRLISVFV